jgi:hypothetical protein
MEPLDEGKVFGGDFEKMEFDTYLTALGHRCICTVLSDFPDQRLDLVAEELFDSRVIESGLFASAQWRENDVDISWGGHL